LAIPGAFADTTVTLDQPVHFTNAEGSDVVLNAGEYAVEPAAEWLRVTPAEGQAVDALLLEATTGNHEESLTAPLALSAEGEQPDTHHLALLLPGGKRLEAVGSYSGIRSRGTLSLLTIQRLKALSSSSQSTTSTEFVTPVIGGSGGNRSYNLDCGNGAVLAGATYKAGSWLDALGIICRRVNSQTGALQDDFTRGPVGGGGGAPRMISCPSGKVVGSLSARIGLYVHNIVMACEQWDAAQKRPIFTENCSGSNCLEVGTEPEYYCPWCPQFSGTFYCPSGKAGKALRGKHGIYIDNFRFVCDSWDK
jgi:hypothetical protein